MSLHSWLQNLRSVLAPRRGKRQHASRNSKRAQTQRPRFEALEDRCVPAFLEPVYYAAGPNPNAVATADFNGDGRLDLATANLYGHLPDSFEGDVSILLGNPDGSFQAARNYPAGVGPDSIAVGDFNGDGKLDLVTGNLDVVGEITVLLGNGDGSFLWSGQTYTIGANTRAVAVGDFNADGKLDVAATGAYDSWATDLDVLLGHGDGTFAPSYFLPNTGGRFDSVVSGDFNSDGNADLAWVKDDLSAVDLLLSNGDGTFQAAHSFATGRSLSVVAADLNGDGKLDLVTANDNDSASVLLGNGDGTFQAAQIYAGGSSYVGDFNGDGKIDLLVGTNLLLGSGDAGTFSANGGGVTLGDFNGDGRWDLARVNGGNGVWVQLNDGIWDGPPPPLPPAVPSLRTNDVTITEGNMGTRTATFTVTLSAASTQAITVAYATANGSAAAGSDYQAASGTLTFAPGEITKTVTVLVNGDRIGEPNETFAVNLSSPTNATIADGQGVGTIVDDEPRISISDVTKSEGGRNKKTLFTFTVTLSVAYNQPVTVSFKTTDGTATTSDNDYVAQTGTITFNPGETSKTITITVKGDSKKESNEYFYVDLFGNSSNSLFTKSRGTGWILNDD